MYSPSALFMPDRLVSLYQRNLLNPSKDAALDRLTEFAAGVLKTPMALITLVNGSHQFILSQFGLSGPIKSAQPTPLTHSFCQYVAKRGEPFLVNDSRVHPLVWDHLATTELKVIAYAGMPLITPDGQLLGSIAALDVRPRRWTPENIEILRAVAALVITELDLRAKTEELGVEHKESERHDAERQSAARLTVHDLRTPLTGLLMSLEMIPLLGALNEDQKDLVSMCARTGGVLRNLIDDLLEIHALQCGGALALHRTKIDPSVLADRAIEQVKALATARSIELTPPTLSKLGDVEIDEEKFTRVLVNLLANAIKFTSRGGRVDLSIRETNEPEPAAVVFSVKDTGLGIQPSDTAKIFDTGVKLNEVAPTRESAGLGLTYCKQVVIAHGGSIWIESQLGKGSTFFVSIPRKADLVA